MTQGARGGATKPCGHGLIGLVEAPADMDANAIWGLLLAERARRAAELEARDEAKASDHELIARLSRIIRDLQRTTFGARSEKLNPDQLALALEDIEQELAAAEMRVATPAQKAKAATTRQANRGVLAGAPAADRAGDRRPGQGPPVLRRPAWPLHIAEGRQGFLTSLGARRSPAPMPARLRSGLL